MTAEAIRCPNCKLYNPPGARRCDCGWDFSKGAADQAYPTTQKSLEGIRGWLLPLAIGLVVSIALHALDLVITWAALNQARAVTSSYFLYQVVVGVIELGFALIVAESFFNRRRRTPLLVIILLVMQFVLSIVHLFVVRRYPMLWSEPAVRTETERLIVRSLVPAVIWIPYFIQSKRVDATFTR